MMDVKRIFLIACSLFLFIFIVACGVPKDLQACNQHSDCVLVPEGCCGCNTGGSNKAINKEYQNYWQDKIGDCSGVMCIQAVSDHYSCYSQPICNNGICTAQPTIDLAGKVFLEDDIPRIRFWPLQKEKVVDFTVVHFNESGMRYGIELDVKPGPKNTPVEPNIYLTDAGPFLSSGRLTHMLVVRKDDVPRGNYYTVTLRVKRMDNTTAVADVFFVNFH